MRDLFYLCQLVKNHNDAEYYPKGVPYPMPVIQGWYVDDYLHCIENYTQVLNDFGGWPDMIGIGSVCRRHLKGKDGIITIMKEITKVFPDKTFHLFGVKGGTLKAMKQYTENIEMDSGAWSFAARTEAWRIRKKLGKHVPCTMDMKIKAMDEWVLKQHKEWNEPALRQLQLWK